MNRLTTVLPEDLGTMAKAAEVMNTTLGDGYTSAEDLSEWVEDNGVLCIVMVEGDVVGAATARVLRDEEARGEERDWGRNYAGLKVGELDSVAVLPEYRGHGLAQMMTGFRLGWLVGQGVNTVVSLSWRTGDNESYPILMKFGGIEIESRPRAFARAVNEESPCPIDGAVCECVGTFIEFPLIGKVTCR